MTSRVLRHSAPRFEISVPARALLPMAAVETDKVSTTYIVPSEHEWQRHYSSFAASKITDHVYLGGYSDAINTPELERRGITRVLNLAEECPVMPSSTIETLHIPLKDHSDEDIAKHFETAVRFLRDAVRAGRSVLVHCRFGVSRSATIVIAYLMRYGSEDSSECPLSYDDAFDYVKLRRSQISPNLGFVLSLHGLNDQHKRESLI